MQSDESWPWFEEKIKQGREIVTTLDPNSIETPQLFQAMTYYRDQERRVAQRGCCEACGTNELRECSGNIVCRRTLNICPKLQLSEIVSLYESAFDEHDSSI
jgi:hypothetical protein